MTRADVRRRHEERLARRRHDEALCALDFLTWGDLRGEHREFCVFALDGLPPCSRDYHPGPPPDDESLYEGTGIGALFGLEGSERHAWQLAGWNLKTSEFEPNPPTIEGK